MSKFDMYKQEAEDRWGDTAAYAEYVEKVAGKNKSDLFVGMESILAAFSACNGKENAPDSPAAQELVEKLQDYITTNFYTCTKEILAELGQMYTADERFKTNINKYGEGTAEFTRNAIGIYCG